MECPDCRKNTSKKSSTPGFRIAEVECCYTCIHSNHGELITCDLIRNHADWLPYKHFHPGVSPIGICDCFKLRVDIGPSKDIWRGDNILSR